MVRTGRLALLTVAAALALSAPTPASAAQRLTVIDTPSGNVDPATVRFNGADHPRRLRANVLLPDGYDGRRRFPVLFLLHGVGDNFTTLSKPATGDILNTARGLRAIVVMPEGARGFYTNWWNGGLRARPGWERFYLDELIPLVERLYRVAPGRRNRAIAGLSMGGSGATWLASQAPGYFGSAATLSGFVQHQRPELEAGFSLFAEVEYTDIFGPVDGFYATGHNPTRLAGNLLHTRTFVTVGDGTAEPGVQSSPAAVAGGGLEEAELRQQNEEFVDALRRAGVDTTYQPRQGVHDWPYWRRGLRAAIEWGLFRPVPEFPRAWVYRTVAPKGEAWGLTYRFSRPPEGIVTLTRASSRLRASGAGTVRLENAAACGFTAALPFDRALPPEICGRISVRVRPRRLRLGRRTLVRFRVTRVVGSRRFPLAKARVRLLGRRTRTNARGIARIRVRPRSGLGRRRARVGIAGLKAARPRLRVIR